MLTQGRTRAQIRQAIAAFPLFGAVVSAASENGDTTSMIDNTLSKGSASDNARAGGWIDFTSGDNSGLISQVTASTVATNKTDMTFAPARTSVVSGDTYIWWPSWLAPANINRLIDNAIHWLTGKAFDPVESLALHGDGRQTRFDIPSTLNEIEEVLYRYAFDSEEIHLCDSVWDTDIDVDVTASLDTKDYREGGGSLKLVVGAGAAAGDILAAQSFSAKDLSGYDYVEFWAKCTAAVAAAGLKLHLHTGAIADGSTSVEVLSLPALTAGTWAFCRVALANPESDTAITYVGPELDADAAYTCWLDGIRVVKNGSALWATLPRHLWSIDGEAKDLILTSAGRALVGSRLMKLVGGANPTLFSADSTVTEAPERYIMAYCMLMILMGSHDAQMRAALPFWQEELRKAQAGIYMPDNARLVG